MIDRIINGFVEDRFQEATITDRISIGGIDEVWIYKEESGSPALVFAYRFYEAQNILLYLMFFR